jgi:hypothetical protein
MSRINLSYLQIDTRCKNGIEYENNNNEYF